MELPVRRLPPGSLHGADEAPGGLLDIARSLRGVAFFKFDRSVDRGARHTGLRKIPDVVVTHPLAFAGLEIVTPDQPVRVLVERDVGRGARQRGDVYKIADDHFLVRLVVLKKPGKAVITQADVLENLMLIQVEFVGKGRPLGGFFQLSSETTNALVSALAHLEVGLANVGIGRAVGEHFVGIERDSIITILAERVVKIVALLVFVPSQLEVEIPLMLAIPEPMAVEKFSFVVEPLFMPLPVTKLTVGRPANTQGV